MNSYKILVVDDEKDNLVTIVEMIEEKSELWDVYQANNGELACLIAEKQQPDLIIMDWEMPGMSGIEATRKLKANELTQDIPVIICTGIMTSSKHLETAFEAGAVDFLRKPIDIIELHSRMQSMLLLSESYKDIKALNSYKNKLLSIIAHDLKNPIYTVKLLADLSLQKNIDEEKRDEILKAISSSVGSTFGLLENLLSWANSQRNKVNFSPEFISLNEIVEENLDLYKLNAESKSIQLNSEINSETIIYGDKNMVSTILRNLISNAVKFSSKGGEVRILSENQKNKLHIKVIDTGIGISKENIARILDDKIQYTTSGTKNESGSGIGLQLCKEFIKTHGWEMKIESVEGKGSVFSFSITHEKKRALTSSFSMIKLI